VQVVVAHGAGSSPGVAVAAFGSVSAHSFWLAGHGPAGDGGTARDGLADDGGTARDGLADDGAADRARLDEAVSRLRPELVAGISYGAHQVARWAAERGPRGLRRRGVDRLALLLPAWTGAPGQVAAATATQADEFDRIGVAAALVRIRAEHPGWVAEALAESWPLHAPARFTAALRAVAVSRGPTAEELAGLRLPVTVVASAADPLHPAAVAAQWAGLLPAGRLVTVRAAHLADLGAAALG
jgi:pimeloyl-ACP methyl ester carboxylesterase